jgi:hypothetical protein
MCGSENGRQWLQYVDFLEKYLGGNLFFVIYILVQEKSKVYTLSKDKYSPKSCIHREKALGEGGGGGGS